MSSDPTIRTRMRRYRTRQTELGRRRLELRLREDAVPAVRAFAGRCERELAAAEQVCRLPLKTMNAPRPQAMDAATLLECLRAETVRTEWLPHMQALFDEVDMGAVHDMVLAGATTFETLYHALRVWRCEDARLAPWIKEMADLHLARNAGGHSSGAGRDTARA
ncbi:MAG: hypothetical protein LDL26_02285 [Caenispirillum bisanense]|uniref:Uncharacterized protein n=1 Tax=Caenispirillum bisanense TaxID=414052 RepID=A0A286GPM0_9PROT|nr:hypothetical protein [Caenispirillum bisanense]MCA1939805.1 hypothetical protein [Caenispirillum bisanense]MCA1971874.1 hypothetical protein [Caenispirillum sp.]SOD97126.1 hypothetical protein SAMN05421508_106264 [Caenispirillum bisanense]